MEYPCRILLHFFCPYRIFSFYFSYLQSISAIPLVASFCFLNKLLVVILFLGGSLRHNLEGVSLYPSVFGGSI